MMSEKKESGRGLAFLPLLVFVFVYLATGVILTAKGVDKAFYQLPSPVAVIIGIVAAFFIVKGTVDEKFDMLVKGCGDSNIVIMCLIYLLAGAFTTVSREIGGVDAVVDMGMAVLSPKYASAGLFVISAFIATATGTSVGTVVAMTPIGVGIAQAGGLNVILAVGAVIGGCMFGDNLSIISDTTIAATRTQRVRMKDKFNVNAAIAIPAAIVTIVLLVIYGSPETVVPAGEYSYDFVKVLPYIFVLVSALGGMNVFVVLTGGILFSGAIGLWNHTFSMLGYSQAIYGGFTGMMDIFLLSMLMGGLARMVERGGGIDWILGKVSQVIGNRKTAELGIAGMVSLTNIATANNTVSILINGELSKKLSLKYGVDPRRTASLLDIFSCVFQGLLPYGAQILIAASLMGSGTNPLSLISSCWYQYMLAIFAIISIFVPYADGYIRRHPLEADPD
ncbi:Na+/H+ antiporter NhaC [Dethiosulfovibrio peptidovorans DSM 11002]|uniref:Na+/H+ antiporter NhaC n=1 Tax=Dethiosulfovibrio peptidovorans DSM 11002 TaxID=469381 RepID=D2Z638_9BACT|nr:Na+/H+ antiporter NhaC family protein [Dethiosulfovibrio peptidovorans]EFC90935.1 Na+/H+ antiporter NhaC [Dethiosulfovibrio peptidovorans DSM 11002]